jgi:ABC-2 type transport system permease protein
MAATQAAPGAGQVARMLGNETGKALRVLWVYKGPLVFQLGYMTALYWLVQFFVGGGRVVGGLLAMTLAAFLAYVVSHIASLRMVAGLLEEVYTGTLEQSLLSPLRPWVASTGRLVAALAEGLVVAVVVAAANLAISVPALHLELPFRVSTLVPLAVTLVDVAGFALLFGGLALVVNSIGAVIHVAQSTILMLNGAFVPVVVFPGWLALAAKLLVPTTLGLDATRQILIDGASLGMVWSNGTLPWAVVHAAVLLTVGWTTYQAAIRRGLREGRLGA